MLHNLKCWNLSRLLPVSQVYQAAVISFAACKNPAISVHCLAFDMRPITLINSDALRDMCLLDEIVQRLMAYRFSVLPSIVSRPELVII